MTFGVKIGIYIAIAVALGGGYAYWHYRVKDSGKQQVIIEQEKKLNVIKDKTHDAQTDALTNPKPRDGLRKYSRPDD